MRFQRTFGYPAARPLYVVAMGNAICFQCFIQSRWPFAMVGYCVLYYPLFSVLYFHARAALRIARMDHRRMLTLAEMERSAYAFLRESKKIRGEGEEWKGGAEA